MNLTVLGLERSVHSQNKVAASSAPWAHGLKVRCSAHCAMGLALFLGFEGAYR